LFDAALLTCLAQFSNSLSPAGASRNNRLR
jgi:hypothetical protein